MAFFVVPQLTNGAVFNVDGIKYEIIEDNNVRVASTWNNKTGYVGNNPSGDYVQPSTINYQGTNYTVTEIGKYAFTQSTNLKSIVIPETVITIADGAFNYSRATTITIPASVTTIGDKAFYECQNLTAINWPLDGNLTSIGSDAFQYCKKLESLAIPYGVTIIPKELCEFCSGLKSLTLHNAITRIESGAFKDCKALESVNYDFAGELTYIGNGAFTSVPGIKHLIIPGNLEYFGSAFSSCQNLEYIWIKEGITEIKSNTFYNCWNIKYVVLPSTLQEVGQSAFGENEILSAGQHNPREYFCLSDTPFALTSGLDGQSHTFGVVRSDDKFYVKESALDAYKKKWSYGNRIDYKIPFSSSLTYSTDNREFDADFHAACVKGNKPFVATSYDSESIKFTSIDDGIVPAETGMLIRKKTDEENWFQIAENQGNSLSMTNYLKGVTYADNINPRADDGSVNMILYNGEFCRFNNAGTLGMHKAYLQLPATAGNAKNISIQIEDSYASGILNMKQADDKAGYFNLNGFSTKRPLHGIYIKNGKKTILK